MSARLLPPPAPLSESVKPFIAVEAGTVVLRNVGLIDGTGAAPADNRTIILEDGRISVIGGPDQSVPDGATVLDLEGHTVLPGIVGMHEHLFYIARPNVKTDGTFDKPAVLAPQMSFSAPRMYLALGVTTLRTAGSVEPYADLNLKADIDAGLIPGPHMDVTGPYLEGPPGVTVQQHRLTSPEDARKLVAYWSDMGVTSFKAYEHIKSAELKAAIEEAHARGIKVTGHLCAVTYPEAIELGIDNLEHGFWVNTQLAPGKEPDSCPANGGTATLAAMRQGSPERQALIESLVEADVALTSTLATFEWHSLGYKVLPLAALDALTADARKDYFYLFQQSISLPHEIRQKLDQIWQIETGLELEFFRAGGLLLVGSDSTGSGQSLPGFGTLRAIELLVESGFTPSEAIQAATLNGAIYLGVDDRIGSVEVGKNADLVVVRGNPADNFADIRNVETVFKDGVGYDSGKLLASVRGKYGQY
jgi:imidazolonepropionase-like amidohydrolase